MFKVDVYISVLESESSFEMILWPATTPSHVIWKGFYRILELCNIFWPSNVLIQRK